MYPEVHKVSKRLRTPGRGRSGRSVDHLVLHDREESQDKRKDEETIPLRTAVGPINVAPASTADDLNTSRGYLPKTVSHPCGLKMTDRLTDVSVDNLHVLAGTVLVRAVSCPGLHPTVDRLVVACGPPDWVGALKRVQGESCPGWHPTVDPLAGWPKPVTSMS